MKIVSLVFGMVLAVSVVNAQQLVSKSTSMEDDGNYLEISDELNGQTTPTTIVLGDKVVLEQGKDFGKQTLYYNPNYKKSSRYIAPIEPMYKKEEVKIELYNPETAN